MSQAIDFKKNGVSVLGDVCGVLHCEGILEVHDRGELPPLIRCSVCGRQRLPRAGELAAA